MSLINQVLQNVEARQGTATLEAQPGTGWTGQVKPVLSHQGSSSRTWGRWLVWSLLLALIGGLFINWPVFIAQLRAVEIATPAKIKVTTLAAPVPAVASAAPKTEQAPSSVNTAWEPPQLTKSLFSSWQVEPSSAASPATARNKTAAGTVQASVKTVAVPQVEGEFTIKPADSAAANAVVSAIEPPLDVATAVKTPKNSEEESGPRGVVSKQVRPEQEVNLLIQRAVDHEQKGRLNEALVTLRQALSTYPQSEDARQLLAAYLFESKQEAEAVTVLQAGIKHYPGQIGLSKSLAKWQLSHAQPDAVLQTLKPVANLLIQDAESQWMLAMAYQQTAQHASALPHFERATILRPGHAQWMVAYAISLQAAGQPAQALQQLQQAYNLPLSERLSEFVSQRIRQLGGSVPARSE